MFAVAVPGVRFVVVDSDDAMVFTVIKPPRLDEYEILMRAGRRQAKEAGLKRRDLERAIGGVAACNHSFSSHSQSGEYSTMTRTRCGPQSSPLALSRRRRPGRLIGVWRPW